MQGAYVRLPACRTVQSSKRVLPSGCAARVGGMRKPPARQQRHQHMGLHIDQHVGAPQQATLACEAVVQVQKGSETGLRQGSLHAVQDSAREPGQRAISRRWPYPCTWQGRWQQAPQKGRHLQQQGHTMAEAARIPNRGDNSLKGKVPSPSHVKNGAHNKATRWAKGLLGCFCEVDPS